MWWSIKIDVNHYFGLFFNEMKILINSYMQINCNYIFMTIFIFYEALKKSRVFLFHLIKLQINFDKEIRR